MAYGIGRIGCFLAGDGTYGYGGDGGSATSAQLAYPEGIDVDSGVTKVTIRGNTLRDGFSTFTRGQ